MAQGIRNVIGAGRALCRVALPLGWAVIPAMAQSVALPASDPVGIARSGIQVAYGYSLEAASLNPALLASVPEGRSAFIAGGLEAESAQTSLEASQQTWYSDDRNRAIGGLGAAFRLSSRLTLGLKVDTPFERHGVFASDSPNRFLGDRLDLSGRRLEVQAAWAITPGLSIGVGLGVANLRFQSGTVLRAGIPLDPTQPVSTANPVDGVAETAVVQNGSKTVPSYSLGLRWAVNPRWTLGLAHQSSYRADLSLSAYDRGGLLGFYANDGLSPALLGTQSRATALVGATSALAGSGRLELPSLTTFGVRHRLNPMITWEADLRWTAPGLQVPSLPGLETPSGPVYSPAAGVRGKGHLGYGMSAEVALGKRWTLRAGALVDRNAQDALNVEPLMGGSSQATFSAGAGYRVWGGEFSFGYQFRQSQDQDVTNLNGVWSAGGYRSTGTRVRVEGMGHLLAIGFRRSF